MSQISQNQYRILVVDDNPANLEVLFAYLDAEGWDVIVAQSGASAIEKATDDPPDIILLDVMMPEMDGFEACTRLKQQYETAHIPVIFITALDDATNKVKGLKLGAADYVGKPFERREVIARVSHHLKIHQLTQSLLASNEQLAQEVHDRTISETKLTATLEELQALQHQLVHTEKLSSLGTMVAGLAHEFNNPLSFIQGNLRYLEKDMAEITTILKLYEQACPEPPPHLQKQLNSTDLPFLLNDLPNIMRSMRTGTERLQHIVESLGTFANLNHAEYRPYNLHKALDSTLLLLEHRLKQTARNIKITKQYDNLPKINCYPSQINQVCLNLLTNAIDALESHDKIQEGYLASATPEITIQTTHSEQAITIRITDNGPGIETSVLANIFDPFFTTKPVGINKGMGLSMSHQIITEQHGGQISVESEPTAGTTFSFTLPIAALPPVQTLQPIR